MNNELKVLCFLLQLKFLALLAVASKEIQQTRIVVNLFCCLNFWSWPRLRQSLASKKGLDIVGAVSTALSNATFDKQVTQQVLIQSDDSSVLSKYKDISSYKRVFLVEDQIGDAPHSICSYSYE